ncbi:hypothetical protein LPJ56_005518 [Coemansia sp. RSA 2599]|nr:hypothetical protein LPJ56_005518 [Coemansia sp. RSA 2599]
MPAILLKQLPDISGPRLSAPNTMIRCDPSTTSVPSKKGTLYIDDHQLVFFSEQSSSGFALDYPSIVIHAVSREPAESSDSHHLYCQLAIQLPGSQKTDDSAQDDADEAFSELRIYPDDKTILDEMFAAMSECAALNPDDDDEVYSDDEDQVGHDEDRDDEDDDPAIQPIGEFDPSNFITSIDQLDKLTPEGRAVLKHLESVIVLPQTQESGRFADAEEAEAEAETQEPTKN